MNRSIPLAFALIIFATSCTTKPAEELKTETLAVRQQLEEMAKELVYFSANNFALGRTVSIKPNRQLRELETLSEYDKELPVILTQEAADQYYETSKRIVRKLSTHRWDETDLIALLDHPDAKVRTLAAAALITTDNPNNVLPLAKLLRDDSPTFPSPPYFRESAHHTHGELFRQTVAHVVIEFVRPYMPDTFVFDALLNRKASVVADFKRHFSTRESPAAICQDFEIWRRRAWGEATDSLEEYNERLHRIRDRLINIPMPDRAWYAMAIGGSHSDIYQRQQQLLSDESIVELARNLGHEKLIRAVTLQVEAPEMFLQPVPSGSPRQNLEERHLRAIRNFILRHAKELLRTDDANQLIDLAAKELQLDGGMLGSQLTIAAAELQPDRAIEIVHNAHNVLFETRSWPHSDELAITLWKKGGISQRDVIIDWFYHQSGIPIIPSKSIRYFLMNIDNISKPDGKILIASIIKDPRLETLDWETTKTLVGILNRRLNPPWIKPNDVDSLEAKYQKSGLESVLQEGNYLGTGLPQESKLFVPTIPQWHARLRERVSEYEQARPR